MTKKYENFKFRQPYQQALYYCSLILDDQAWPWDEEFSALSHLEATDLGFFLPHMLSKTFIECYFAGLSYLIDLDMLILAQKFSPIILFFFLSIAFFFYQKDGLHCYPYY